METEVDHRVDLVEATVVAVADHQMVVTVAIPPVDQTSQEARGVLL